MLVRQFVWKTVEWEMMLKRLESDLVRREVMMKAILGDYKELL